MKLKSLLVGVCLALTSISAMAQSDIDQLIKGSLADANFLVKGYVTPAFNTLGNGLNQGWYNTAKPHKTLGFDLTVTTSGVFIPNSDLSYRVDNSQLKNLANTPYPTTKAIDAPTIFGSDTAPVYQALDNNGAPIPNQTVTSAPGTNLGKDVGLIPVPMVQLGVGLPKGTDLKLRFFPDTKLGNNGHANMFGFAIMHDVKQYIPGVKSLPFDLSALFGYTSLKMSYDLDPTTNPSQKAEFGTSATTVQGLISKKFSVLTLYGGVGYNFVSSNLNVKGTFNLGSGNGSVTDPVGISNSQSGPRITGGFRLKFAIFTLHADYTLQKYSAVTAGFGFNVR